MDVPYETYSVTDPAIDRIAMGLRGEKQSIMAYLQDRDASMLLFKPEMQPAVFVTRALRRSEMENLSAESNDAKRYNEAFRRAVTSVKHWNGHPVIEPGDIIPGTERKAWTSLQLDMFPMATLQEIGHVVWQRSFFGGGQGLQGGFAPLPWLVSDLARLMYRDAVQHGIGTSEDRPETPTSSETPAAPKPGARAGGARARARTGKRSRGRTR